MKCAHRSQDTKYQPCGREAHAYKKQYGKGVDWYCDKCAADQLGMQGAFNRLSPEEELCLEIMER